MAASSPPRIAPLLALFCLSAAVSMPSPALGAGIPLGGLLLVSGWTEALGGVSYVMVGNSDVVNTPLTFLDRGDMSPDTTKVVYNVRHVVGFDLADSSDVWVGNVDGSDSVNITGPTGLGGVNCTPRWSPDGRMIVFQHAPTPVAGQRTCDAGWTIWLMSADGTNLHQWQPSGVSEAWFPSWMPDGYGIRAYGWGVGYVNADISGANVAILPAVAGGDAEWSKDGLKVSYDTMVPDTVGGEPGLWRKLCVADADGSNPRVIVQQFLKDSDITAHIAKYDFQPADHDWLSQIRGNAGPQQSRWSPLGDQVVFVAALPFDPNGPEFWYQREVWLYDLSTSQLTRLTNDVICEDGLSWAGPNTTSTHSTVTVGNTSVTFPQVNRDGWTSIIRTEDLPPLPTLYLRLDNFYQITSTAQVSGPATVAMGYADGDVAATAESHIAMLHYNAATAQWEDVTVSRETAQKVVSGQSASLGLTGLAYPLPPSHFSDVPSSVTDPYWALWEIEAAYAAGIVKGYSDGTYKPTDPVTRDQMAVYISRALVTPSGDAAIPDPVPPATFSDVSSTHWAYKHIEYAVAQNVVKGYDDGTYKPDLVVDRGQMAVFVARAMVTPSGDAGIPDPVPPATFSDVPSGFWAYKQVEYCVGQGVVKGYDDGTYRPGDPVTRDQMAVYVARAFELAMWGKAPGPGTSNGRRRAARGAGRRTGVNRSLIRGPGWGHGT